MTTSLSYHDSYIGQLRALVGNRKLIVVTTRALIQDEAGRLLFVRRNDNSEWVMPSGALELDESLFDSMKREVKEEAGLDVITAHPMAIYTYLDKVTAYGDAFAQISIQFLVTQWSGALVTKTDETSDARFFAIDDLPDNVADHYTEVLADWRDYDGRFLLKETQ